MVTWPVMSEQVRKFLNAFTEFLLLNKAIPYLTLRDGQITP